MPALLVILLVLVPLAEIYLVLQVGAAIGAGWTVLLLVADSLVGAWLLKVEGRRTWSQFRAALDEGRWPGDEVAQGALVIVGGTLLLIPGFLTDAVGLVMLLVPTRRVLSRYLRSHVGPDGVAWRRRSSDGDAARSTDHLEVEVVEIEREQRPLDGPDRPDGPDDPPGGPSR